MSLGRGKRKHFLGHTRAEVAAKLTAAQADRQQGIPVVSSTQNVAQYLDYWLASIKGSVRPRTYESYDYNIRRLKPFLGRTRLNMLTPASIENAYSELRAQHLSNRTILHSHTVFHNALKKAVQWGLIGRNPTEAVSRPRPERHEMKTLDEEQVKVLFAATQGDRLHGLWVLLATTGLRIGEALGLRWEDIDFTEERLVVRRALQRQRDKGLVLVEPKTAKSRRTVYFPAGTAAALREQRRLQLEEKLRLGSAWQDKGFIFTRENGEPMDPSGLPAKLHRITEKAGLPRIRVHDLRHTAATLHLARGEHPKVVQELLGHSTIALTMDTYSHVTPALHAAAAKRMQALFAEG